MGDSSSARHQTLDGSRSSGAAEPGEDGSASDLEPDDIYHILQTSRRRDVLRYLRSADGPVALRDLAEQVAAWEHETSVERLTSSQRQRVYISLYQSHLPKLDNRGIVDYNKDRGIIEPAPLAARFDPYLVGLEGDSASDRWPIRYVGVVGGCALFLAAVGAGVVPLSWFVAALVTLVAFAVVTAVHTYSTLD